MLCALSKAGIIRPHFFEDEYGHVVTVNSERCVAMLQDYFMPHLEENEFDIPNIWFQQDGATACTVGASMNVVREAFPGRLIYRNGDIVRPPRSPDLSPCDFFLWGYLKSKVTLANHKLLMN